jgi:hypothetical protein
MDYATAFVHEFCLQLARAERGLRHMHAFYVFSDKRPGTVRERFEADAKQHAEYTKLFQP